MRRLIGNFILYITSFFPLFLIILVLDFEGTINTFPYIKFEHSYFMFPILIILILSIVTVFLLILAIEKYSNDENVTIIDYANNNSDILIYMLNYVIPFLGIPSSKLPVVVSIMLIVSFIVFTKSDLKRFNFMLFLFGYNIYEANVKSIDNSNNNRKKIYILSKKNIDSNGDNMYRIYELFDNVFIL